MASVDYFVECRTVVDTLMMVFSTKYFNRRSICMTFIRSTKGVMIRWPVWLWGKWKGEKPKGKERGVTLCVWSYPHPG